MPGRGPAKVFLADLEIRPLQLPLFNDRDPGQFINGDGIDTLRRQLFEAVVLLWRFE